MEGERDRYRILGIGTDEKENRAGSPGAVEWAYRGLIVLINCQDAPAHPLFRRAPQSGLYFRRGERNDFG